MSRAHARVLIVGGSVAGLTLANALEQTGIDYLLLEKWHDIAPDVGASICIFPNGFRILDQLGCYDAIRALYAPGEELDHVFMRNEHGKMLYESHGTNKPWTDMLGYQAMFIDRKSLLQLLYDNIKDKSKVLLSKGVVSVTQSSTGVQVNTTDGGIYTGDLLVGSDGVHSIVRREIWRIAETESPGTFHPKESLSVPTNYHCLFGISKASPKYHKQSVQYIFGHGYSHLLVSAPRNRMYWFIFQKLQTPIKGLYERLPRYSAADADALAQQHANDDLGDGLRFGELYASRLAATLQATPETVFSKWHYGRMIYIGDAAHKVRSLSLPAHTSLAYFIFPA